VRGTRRTPPPGGPRWDHVPPAGPPPAVGTADGPPTGVGSLAPAGPVGL